MPLCTRAGLDKPPNSQHNFDDNDLVFYCETTKEIFQDYEDYFQRVMLLNSTIWSCTETGQQNLTYAEAVKSERRARQRGASLNEILRAPTLMVIEAAKQSTLKALLSKIYAFLKVRIFLGEEVLACKPKSTHYIPCKVMKIITPKQLPADGVYNPNDIKYKLQGIKNEADTWEANISSVRRKRFVLTLDCLKAFVKEHSFRDEHYISVKPQSFQKYVTNKKITLGTFYVGKMPKWEPAPKSTKGLKQVTMGNYVVKDIENSQKALLSLKEEMDRLRREKEAKLAEQERKRLELMAKLDEELLRILRKCDDLERNDQKRLPIYKAVKTLVPSKYFGEFLMIQEFLHSFSPILLASDVFRKNITFQEMCRAFLIREVAGPLSDILQVLLSTVFALQIDENNDCPVKYTTTKKEGYLWTMANCAIESHFHVSKYFSMDMSEIPMDAQTLSEILRLHLLGSGASVDERSERWRFQYRNGYSVIEDPGLLLRIEQPHILRALKMYTIYQLPFKDILKVLNCLIEQILTYNASILCIEERQDALIKVRSNLRMLIQRENKRLQYLVSLKKTIAGEFQTEVRLHQDNAEKKAELERIMNKKLKDLDEQDERDRKNFEYELSQMSADLFDYLVLLGTDRAYRKYYVFESLPGLFIEHPVESIVDPCLINPPKNDKELANLNNQRGKLRNMLFSRFKQNDKENVTKEKAKPVMKPQFIENGQVIVKLNGSSTPIVSEKIVSEPAANELYMCSGDPKNCIVHDPKHPGRTVWAYISTEDELNTLIESLNVLGIRESELKEQLIKLKRNIILHLAKCPENILNIDLIANPSDSMAQMLNVTRRKYANSNFGFPENANINDVMIKTLADQILELESNITNGCLGKLRVPDIEKWRKDIASYSYDSQCKKLIYGPENSTVTVKYKDPGDQLGDTMNIESEDSSDEGILVHDSPAHRKNVKDLASALLQIEQSIEQKFLKEPFGVKFELKDKVEMDARLVAGKLKLKYWEVSLLQSTSFSQVFLHLNILSDAVKWNKSTKVSSCLICNRRGDADKLLLCDKCNAGTHMFCMKPKMKKIPEGDWFCHRCELKFGLQNEKTIQKRKRKKIFSMHDEEEEKECDSETDEDEYKPYMQNKKKHTKKLKKKTFSKIDTDLESENSSDDEVIAVNSVAKEDSDKEQDVEEASSEISDDDIENPEVYLDGDFCRNCKSNGTDISCGSCKECYHLDCVGLRRSPRGVWLCGHCKKQKDGDRRKRRADFSDSSNDDEYEEIDSKAPPAKRSRRRNNNQKDDVSTSSDEVSRNNNNSRRVRRKDEFLKFNTIALYELLEQIMKHDAAWPFLRPVTQYEVPDYHEIIKNPMDFARIKSNLNMCRYRTNEEVLRDIQLVFSNCDTYNTEGNDIYKAGAALERFVIDKCKKLNLHFTPSDMVSDIADK